MQVEALDAVADEEDEPGDSEGVVRQPEDVRDRRGDGARRALVEQRPRDVSDEEGEQGEAEHRPRHATACRHRCAGEARSRGRREKKRVQAVVEEVVETVPAQPEQVVQGLSEEEYAEESDDERQDAQRACRDLAHAAEP